MHRVCQAWKDLKDPQVQMGLLDNLDHLVPMDLQETEELLAYLVLLALWEHVDLKDLKESEEILACKERRVLLDLLVFRGLLDPWAQEENEVRKEALASQVHQVLEEGQVTRVHQDQLVIWDLQVHRACQDHLEKLDHLDQQESGVREVLLDHQVSWVHLE